MKLAMTFALVVAMVSASPATGVADGRGQREIYNLAQDIGTTWNQISFSQGSEGVWYFLASQTTVHNPRLYRFLREFNAPARPFTGITIPEGFSCWQEPGVLPDVCFNFNDHSVTLESFDVPSRTVDMHPASGRLSIVGWKSPIHGVVAIRGSFSDLDPNCGNGVVWSIDKNDKTLVFDDLPNGTAQTFSLSAVKVHPGDVLYFIVDPNGDYACDSTALRLTIRTIDSSR